MNHIWTFNDNEYVETDHIEQKQFKPVGKFFEDVQTLTKLFNIKVHPALKPVTNVALPGEEQEEQKQKETNTLTFYKHRLDKNSLKVLFWCLPASPAIHTLKFQNNGFSHQQLSLLVDYLCQDSCTVQHLFCDWNPVHANNYSTDKDVNDLYVKGQGELCLFAKLLKQNSKLQVLFLRASNLSEEDLIQIWQALKPDPAAPAASNKTLKVLDVSYNPLAFTEESMKALYEMLELNRSLEYLGLAKNGLKNQHLEMIAGQIGRMPFPQEQVEAHQAKLKQRDQIVEKNKKLKNSKKAEEPVPLIDNLEQTMTVNVEGQEVPAWVVLKNTQFKHLNLCMNELDDECRDALLPLLKRTNDDFGITLAGNPLSKDVISKLQAVAMEVHQKRVQQLDPNLQTQVDQAIGLKRISF